MHLIHQSTVKEKNGVVTISILIVDGQTIKPYSYSISQFAAELFHKYYTMGKGMHRSALAVLDFYKITEVEKLEKIIASNIISASMKLAQLQYLLRL